MLLCLEVENWWYGFSPMQEMYRNMAAWGCMCERSVRSPFLVGVKNGVDAIFTYLPVHKFYLPLIMNERMHFW